MDCSTIELVPMVRLTTLTASSQPFQHSIPWKSLHVTIGWSRCHHPNAVWVSKILRLLQVPLEAPQRCADHKVLLLAKMSILLDAWHIEKSIHR